MSQQNFLQVLLLCATCGFATSGYGQGLPVAPPKGSNIVWVRTDVHPDTVFNVLTRHLQQRGFVLDTLDKVRGILTTKVNLHASARAEEMKLRASRVGADWKLIGTYVIPAYGSGVAYPAEFVGAEMMPAKTAFRLVEEAARVLPGGTLRYDKAKVKFGVFTKLDDALRSVW